ncbi:regulatory protein RecX [Proteinivorax hydrogeniformans]|uniref:Regulatory protein RecX n=1 Tax=Proteinivorax hydrogeniformans TaxID=1826727 RepID=A0AAU8HNL8_9FIRM
MNKAQNMALRYLSYKPRTKKELQDYLSNKGISSLNIEEVVQKLEGYGYINDDDYAVQFINYHAQSKLNGPQKIRFELFKRGVENDKVDKAFDSLDIDFFTTAKRLVEKKQSSNKTFQQLYGFLRRRGFNHNHSMQAIKFLEKED